MTGLGKIIPDAEWPDMYRIVWPDGVVSPMANLTRCKDAVICYAEKAENGLSVFNGFRAYQNGIWRYTLLARAQAAE